jgi:hypothetical protein
MGPDRNLATFKLGRAFTSMRVQSQHQKRSAPNQESQPLFDVTRTVHNKAVRRTAAPGISDQEAEEAFTATSL